MAEPCTSAGAIECLLGAAVPTSRFGCYARTPVALPELGEEVVLYLYPGSVCSPEDGYESPLRDSVQHRSFEDRRESLRALGYSAVKLSSQSVDTQWRVAADTGVSHTLLSDPDLVLPTFNMDRDDWYCRVTLLIQGGRIAAAFHPTSAARSAGEAIARIQEQGGHVAANSS
jgi:peroxiredoxin